LSPAAELGGHADVVELEAAEAVKAEKIAAEVQAAEAEREAKAAAARPVTADGHPRGLPRHCGIPHGYRESVSGAAGVGFEPTKRLSTV
jgi:hypothetical protein